ncbi:MAG: GNAT family N-acetyltransferase [Terracidiphilus sp.]|nr:GNAT family N-acetyltransferase [Terracidiphilus sp.]
MEILDLRHFTSTMLRPVLEAEGDLWRDRLHWDYRNSTRLLMQYLDNRMLPGYAAVSADMVAGYAFCVYEESKAVIGDVFAMDGVPGESVPASAISLQATLLNHMLELLVNSPQVERIESQLLIHPSGTHTGLFRTAGFDVFRRLFLVQRLEGRWSAPRIKLPEGLELRLWKDEDLAPAARLISEAYRDHPDSMINDQYRTVHGSMRFLNNIVRYAGCGVFSQPVSWVVAQRDSRELAALILGSRVSPASGHITQVCVHPEFRHKGLGRMMLELAAHGFLKQGAEEVSLTVTEANRPAIALYLDEGYTCAHSFDAAVWQRRRIV